ncbi:helicase-related protein [Clostridium lacusfryxellense]|uniref:helicase-related protein n=1 Tax=Clostridium lacusfryxellense TaxID=205328 RepID=UPI001C0AD10C|nr:helicase-related protein [Clostridium lacusfryxellense]MBU3110175.1 NgoFVII family restriction endonuclease [Clostridium lacusfryxellense]
MKMNTIDSTIIDNKSRGTVGDFLKANIEKDSEMSIVSAYFTIYAYMALKYELNSINKLNFLFGEPSFLRSINPDKTSKMEFKIEDDKLTIPIEKRLKQKNAAKECSEWIEKKVNIRSIVKSNFLHGKMYHIKKVSKLEKAVIGSSNFTVNGLGLSNNPNIELNVEIDSDRDRKDILNWFNELWNDQSGLVEDVKDDVLKYLNLFYQDNSPQMVYYKTLYHIFEGYISEQKENDLIDERAGFFDTEVWKMLYDFQKDGVRGAINKIIKHNGCIIADSVGLGKTFEALAVIKYFELLNYKVLVLCPKKLKENWTIFRRNDKLNFLNNDRFSFDVLCHTDLSREAGYSGDINLATINWGNYGLVVIDESHNFKNDNIGKKNENGNIKLSRYGHLMNNIIKAGIKTKVLLLSATPVNNNLKDLRNQIYFITEGKNDTLKETSQILDIKQTIKNAQTQFSNWANPTKNPNRSTRRLLENLDSSFFKLLDELTISRSRQHIMKYYNVNKIGKFPVRLKPISKAPGIDIKKEFPSYDVLNSEILHYKLSLFKPSSYIKDEFKAIYRSREKESGYNFDQETRENYLIDMMKVNFLKRLESSIESFEISMKRTVDKIESVENRIFKFLNGNNSDQLEYDHLMLLPEDEDNEDTTNLIGGKLKFNLAHLNLDLWLKDLNSDKKQLKYLYDIAEKVTIVRDEKLSVLMKVIEGKLTNPINIFISSEGREKANKKILIFTAFADTAEYLYASLNQWVVNDLNLDIALVKGGNENKTTFKPEGFKKQLGYNEILVNFCPLSKNRNKMGNMPQENEIDILIATDCISEGQNLQDCDYLINYDIHWNPVRIIQRFGRIDRIGSINSKIQMVNFWPTDDLNKYIKLKDRVESRMTLVDITASGEDNVLTDDQIKDVIEGNISFRDKQLIKLKDEVLDLEDIEGNINLSEFNLSDFRVDLVNYLKANEKLLRDTPCGIYAIVSSPQSALKNNSKYDELNSTVKSMLNPGVIFCLKKKETTKYNETMNPLQAYFLVYMYEDGNIKYNYTNAKQILDIYRLLCSDRETPIDELCDLFNKETNQGTDVDNYTLLLKNAVSEIGRIFRKRSLKALQSTRNAVLISKENQINNANDFELITWLIIK